MSNFPISRRLTQGILGGLCFLSELILPASGGAISNLPKSGKVKASSVFSKQTIFDSDLNTTIEYNYIALSWNEIWHALKRKKVPGGSRSVMSNLCLVAPNGLVNLESSDNGGNNRIEIWHQNPLFIWQSEALSKIVLKNEKNESDIYWEKEIDTSSTYLFYDGKPLQIGETYKLIVFAPYETEIYRLQVLASNKHQQIEADLRKTQLEGDNLTQEEIALAKASYFIEKQMWSDVLWELYSIPNPTDELKTTLQQVNSHNFCQ